MQTLSDESRRFLEDLTLYLLASGKNEQATQDIVTELEDHLQEAEADGKSVAAITGDSPAAYIQSIASEMTTDYRESFWLLFQILAGVFSFLLFQDLLDGPLSYSLYFLVGFIILISSLLIVLSRCLRYSATHTPSKRPFLVFGLSTGVIFLLLMGLFLTDSQVTSPTIHFSWLTSSIIGLSAFLLIGYSSYRAKTWILPLGLLAYLLPQFFLRYQLDWSALSAVGVGYICGSILMTGLFFLRKKIPKNESDLNRLPNRSEMEH